MSHSRTQQNAPCIYGKQKMTHLTNCICTKGIYLFICMNIYQCYVFKYIYAYIQSICGQQPFRSLRAHQHSSYQMKILKDQSAQTNARAVSVACRLWLPFLINRVLNLTMLRSVIYDQSADSSRFAL